MLLPALGPSTNLSAERPARRGDALVALGRGHGRGDRRAHREARRGGVLRRRRRRRARVRRHRGLPGLRQEHARVRRARQTQRRRGRRRRGGVPNGRIPLLPIAARGSRDVPGPGGGARAPRGAVDVRRARVRRPRPSREIQHRFPNLGARVRPPGARPGRRRHHDPPVAQGDPGRGQLPLTSR